MQRRMFISESQLHIPDFIQTASGGKRIAMMPRKISPPDMTALVAEDELSWCLKWRVTLSGKYGVAQGLCLEDGHSENRLKLSMKAFERIQISSRIY